MHWNPKTAYPNPIPSLHLFPHFSLAGRWDWDAHPCGLLAPQGYLNASVSDAKGIAKGIAI